MTNNRIQVHMNVCGVNPKDALTGIQSSKQRVKEMEDKRTASRLIHNALWQAGLKEKKNASKLDKTARLDDKKKAPELDKTARLEDNKKRPKLDKAAANRFIRSALWEAAQKAPGETSYWIKFITDAGIPAGDAAHYAILFADNRISKGMMLDLSKDYLKDMGITRLGDVIAILKHAQKVHNQEAKDLLLKSSHLSVSALRSSSPSTTSTPRRSTAASRMVNHFTSKHPEASPMSQQPVLRPASPDLPSSKRKVSVFERLGAEGGEVTVSVPKSSQDSGVFSRLGGKTPVKRAASSTSVNDLDDDGDRSLPYVGVLKNSDSPLPVRKKKKVEIVPTVKMSSLKKQNFQIESIKKTIASTNITISNIQRPEISTTEGVLSAYAKKEAPSLRERLGSKSELPTSTTSTKKDKAKSKIRLAKASVQNRLGAKQEDQSSSSIVSSTQKIQVKLKKAKEISLRKAKQDINEKPAGVFSRLGKLSTV